MTSKRDSKESRRLRLTEVILKRLNEFFSSFKIDTSLRRTKRQSWVRILKRLYESAA